MVSLPQLSEAFQNWTHSVAVDNIRSRLRVVLVVQPGAVVSNLKLVSRVSSSVRPSRPGGGRQSR